jgi:hypothetical protein
MKNFILLLILVTVICAVQAQDKPKLKDLLFSGKLKKDSTGMIRSTDDLSKKIDTSSKKVDSSVVKKDVQSVNANSPTTNVAQNSTAPVTTTAVTGTVAANIGDKTANTDTAAVAPVTTTSVKSNSKIWKDYTDSLTKVLQEEVLKAKQIKKDTYFILVDYEIATDGQVTINNVTSSPENAFLQGQIKQIMDSTPLKLNPVTDSNNQAKKVKRRQQFTVTKE